MSTQLDDPSLVQLGLDLLTACRCCHKPTDQEDNFGEPQCSACAESEALSRDEQEESFRSYWEGVSDEADDYHRDMEDAERGST